MNAPRFILSTVLTISLAVVTAAGAQTTHSVDVGPGFTFTPPHLTIDVGDTVVWTWMGGSHSVESGVGGVHDGHFSSGVPALAVGTMFTQTFDAAFLASEPEVGNVYPYYCVVHFGLGMTGEISVLEPQPPEEFVRGDCNNDGGYDIADAVTALAFLFPTAPPPAPLACPDACDCNDDEVLNIADAVSLLGGLFGALSIPPAAPHPDCGLDPAGDDLDCSGYSYCPPGGTI